MKVAVLFLSIIAVAVLFYCRMVNEAIFLIFASFVVAMCWLIKSTAFSKQSFIGLVGDVFWSIILLVCAFLDFIIPQPIRQYH
jgi:hypothetical protein